LTDPFARQTAQHAHQRIHELTGTIRRLEQQVARRREFRDRCYLCGDPVKHNTRYCRACSWAENP
jgi:hypothetical protein